LIEILFSFVFCANYIAYSWRRIKKDFLHHNHKPRIDYLVWVLLEQLGPHYTLQLQKQGAQESRIRGLAAWREAFRSEWRRCVAAQITLPLNIRYNPLPYKWVCTCPSFVKSRFLLCKHLVQSVDPVPEEFFAEVNRERSCPIWRHPRLHPIQPPSVGDLPALAAPTMPLANAYGINMDSAEAGEVGGYMDGEAEELGEEDEEAGENAELLEKERSLRRESMSGIASRLHELADMLEYNAPFADQRVVDLAIRKTAAAVDLQEKLKNKENRINSSTSTNPPTFSPQFAEVMFVRTRPPARIRENRSKYQPNH
jgi:hypothetical protein